MRKRFFALLLALAVLSLDQLSKWYILGPLNLSAGPIEVAPFFNLVMVWNRGISFGFFSERNQPLIFVVLSLLIMLILLRWLAKTQSLLVSLSLGAVLGGAAGNVVDRIRLGAVADFLDFHISRWHWPAFNLADSAIVIGVAVLFLEGMFKHKDPTH